VFFAVGAACRQQLIEAYIDHDPGDGPEKYITCGGITPRPPIPCGRHEVVNEAMRMTLPKNEAAFTQCPQ